MVIMSHFLERGEERKRAGVVSSFEEVGRAQKGERREKAPLRAAAGSPSHLLPWWPWPCGGAAVPCWVHAAPQAPGKFVLFLLTQPVKDKMQFCINHCTLCVLMETVPRAPSFTNQAIWYFAIDRFR